MKHAQLRWTGANTKIQNNAYKTLKTAGVQTSMLKCPAKQFKKKRRKKRYRVHGAIAKPAVHAFRWNAHMFLETVALFPGLLLVLLTIVLLIYVITVIIIIIIIIIAFKDEIWDFLQSTHCSVNCLQHVRSSGPGAIVCKSCATHRPLITCNMAC